MIQGKVWSPAATGDMAGQTVEELLLASSGAALAMGEDDRSKRLQDGASRSSSATCFDFGQVRSALNGTQGLLIYPIRPGIVQATAYFAQAAKEAGVDHRQHVADLREGGREEPRRDRHWLSERVFDWSGLTVAHIRPTYFAEWLLYVAPMIREGKLHCRSAPAARPIGAETSACDRGPSSKTRGRIAARVYPLFGTRSSTATRRCQVLSRVLGRSRIQAGQLRGVPEVRKGEGRTNHTAGCN